MDPRTANSTWHIELQRARAGAGLSQRELALRVGMTQAHISRIESGLVDPRLSTVVEIAKAVGSMPVLIPRRALPAVLGVLRNFEGRGARGRRPSAVELLVADDEEDDR